ncbi:MAG: hypothetical protein RLN81_02975 [Balneolaceae bacterium]
MNLSDLSPFFEVIAVFNFAYYGSGNFNITINNKIFQSAQLLRDKLDTISRRFDQIYLKVGEVSQLDFGMVNGHVEKKILISLKNPKQELDKLKTDFRNQKIELVLLLQKWMNLNGFTKLCLVNAFYCLLILIYSGISSSFDNPTLATHLLLLANTAYLLLEIRIILREVWLFYRDLDGKKSSDLERIESAQPVKIDSLKIIKIMSAVLFGLFITYHLFRINGDDFIFNFDLTSSMVFSSLLIPIVPYVGYFFVFNHVHTTSKIKVSGLISEFIVALDIIEGRIEKVKEVCEVLELKMDIEKKGGVNLNITLEELDNQNDSVQNESIMPKSENKKSILQRIFRRFFNN